MPGFNEKTEQNKLTTEVEGLGLVTAYLHQNGELDYINLPNGTHAWLKTETNGTVIATCIVDGIERKFLVVIDNEGAESTLSMKETVSEYTEI
jgi:hypothetical protein